MQSDTDCAHARPAATEAKPNHLLPETLEMFPEFFLNALELRVEA